MIQLQDITRKYVKFYTAMREYVWPFDTVQDLAELEISIYNRFPDTEDIKKRLNLLYMDIRDTLKEDEDLQKTYNKLKESLDSSTIYADLYSVKEEYDYEDLKEQENSAGSDKPFSNTSRPTFRRRDDRQQRRSNFS